LVFSNDWLWEIVRKWGLAFFDAIGSEIVDCQTGARLGRAFVFCWGGRVYLLGSRIPEVVVVPIPEKRIAYWKKAIGFTVHSSREVFSIGDGRGEGAERDDARFDPLLVLLDHRGAEEVEAQIGLWEMHGFSRDRIFLAHGGRREDFERVGHSLKAFFDDGRLKTRDHQRERQSYRCVQRGVADWLRGSEVTHVLFMEYDHFPIVDAPAREYWAYARKVGADVLGYEVRRLDGTLNSHWLGNVEDAYGAEVAISMLGTGHFWTREAWVAVAGDGRFAGWYLELDLPTTALHLGFRVGGIPEQDAFVKARVEWQKFDLLTAKEAGAWTLHPVRDGEEKERKGVREKGNLKAEREPRRRGDTELGKEKVGDGF